MSIFAILTCILLAAFLYLAHRSIRRTLRRRQSATEPTCAHCGYTVLGLTTPTCPECGSNLLNSGIRPPGRSHPRPILAFGWTLFILALIISTSIPLLSIHYHTADTSFDLGIPYTNNSPVILLYLYGEGYSPNPSTSQIDIYGIGASPKPGESSFLAITHGSSSFTTQVPSGPQGRIIFQPDTNHWMFTTPSDSVTAPTLTPSDLEAWLTKLGFPPNADRSRELVAILATAIKAPDVHRYVPPASAWFYDGSSRGESNETDWKFIYADAWLFAFLWAIFLGPILIRRPKPLHGNQAAHLLSFPSDTRSSDQGTGFNTH